jgi:hypothetical protein
VKPCPEGDILVDGHRQHLRLLGEHADLFAQPQQISVGGKDVFAVNEDFTRHLRPIRQVNQAIEATQKSRLAASRRSQHYRDLPVGNFHAHFPQRFMTVITHRQVADDDVRHRFRHP